jgi:hypothetical protein
MMIEVAPTTNIPLAGLLEKRTYSKRNSYVANDYNRKKTRSSKNDSESPSERKSEKTLVKRYHKKDTSIEKVPANTMTEQRKKEDYEEELQVNKSCISSSN